MTTYAVAWEIDMPPELGGGRGQVVALSAHERIVADLNQQQVALLAHCETLVDALQDAWWVRAADALRCLERACAAPRPDPPVGAAIVGEVGERRGSPASDEAGS